MFTESAWFYDRMYAWKDYAAESARLLELIAQHKRSDGNRLLDVACGTGAHLKHLCQHFDAEGLDLGSDILAVARQKLPDVPLHQADMVDFDLGRPFDAITCLFSAIGHAKTLPLLRQAIANMARHLRPGSVLIVEPWFSAAQFHPGTIHATFINDPDLKVARMNLSEVQDGVSILAFDYLVGTPQGVSHFTERHELGLFDIETYQEAFRLAGLEAHYDEQGLMGRGLHIGVRPLA